MTTAITQDDLAQLHMKLDVLTEKFEAQEQRQRELDELKRDLIPIGNQMMRLTIEELEEIGSDFQLEDLTFLVKRLLRDTRMLYELLERLEATMDLTTELTPMGMQAFNTMIAKFDELERKGYFSFAREGWSILDRVVTEFSEEDVKALGDNIVTILTTVRSMTQPEVLSMADNALEALQENDIAAEDISTLSLLREMRDPKVRLGLARMLNMVKVLAEQPPQQSSPN